MPATNPPKNFPALWAIAWGEDAYGYWQAFEIKSVRQMMRWIPAGEFLMGSPESEAERRDNEKQHKVTFQQGYWLADTACTQELWQAVMGENPSDFDEDAQNPVDSVNWHDCQKFINKANKLLGTDWLSLPSEASWEYACRAGTTSPFSFGETVTTDQANFDGNYPYINTKKGTYRQKTVTVLEFSPNPLGLFQMHGNVREWCEGIYQADYLSENILDRDDSSQRVLRGGSWFSGARYLRSAARLRASPDIRFHNYGLRLAGV